MDECLKETKVFALKITPIISFFKFCQWQKTTPKCCFCWLRNEISGKRFSRTHLGVSVLVCRGYRLNYHTCKIPGGVDGGELPYETDGGARQNFELNP